MPSPVVPPRFPTRRHIALFVAFLCVLRPLRPSAHEVPADLTVQAFAKPAAHQLQLVIRVPLSGLLNSRMPKEGPGYLALTDIGPSLHETSLEVAAAIDLYENGQPLAPPTVTATRISLPLDRSFDSYDHALAHLTGPPLPAGTEVFWEQGFMDAILDYQIQSAQSDFSMHAKLTPLAPAVTTTLQFLAPSGSVRSFTLPGDQGLIWFEPHWYQAALRFFRGSVFSAVTSSDLYFLLACLVIVAAGQWMMLVPWLAALVATQAAVIVATQISGTPPADWLTPVVDVLRAAVIVYLALENIAAESLRRRWMAVAAFGLLSGVRLSTSMQPIVQFSGTHQILSWLTFGIGAAVAELAMTGAIALPLLLLCRLFRAARMRTIILSALVASVAWQLVMSRGALLQDIVWPVFDATMLATMLSWALTLVIGVGILWFGAGLLGHRATSEAHRTPASAGSR
jgi:hypothetical protein